MAKILFLGAAPHQCTAIGLARERNHTVYTCDNVSANPGHRLADRSFDISVVDHRQVAELAQALRVDAVVGYASEPCSLAAAVVADAMNLPGPGALAARTLADKQRFRELLRDQGLQELPFAVFEESDRAAARRWALAQAGEVVIKPVDASGSKGVTLKPAREQLDEALRFAFSASSSRRLIIEAFIPRKGAQVGGDGYFENGRLSFVCFGDSYSVPGVIQPDILSKTFPSAHDPESLRQLGKLIEDSARAAGLRNSPINFDALIQPNGQPFLIEMAARNGGNCLPDLIALQTDVHLAEAAIEGALDRDWKLPVAAPVELRWHANYMLHGTRAGRLKALHLAGAMREFVAEFRPYALPGTPVVPFAKANDALGCVLLRK